MPTTPPGPSQAPLRQPPALSLINASRTLTGDTNPLGDEPVRWEGGGVEFQPLPCTVNFEPFSVGCAAEDLDDGATQDPVQWEPIVLWTGVQCTPLSQDLATVAARARALLDIDQHRQLEREFWTGELAAADSLPNLWLAKDNTVDELEGGSATGFVEALTDLQQALGDCNVGRGMIHATVRTTSLWVQAGLLRRQGALLLDYFDNIVVPGVGYPGSAPGGSLDASGDTAWAYATGIVDTRLGAVFVPEGPGVVDRAGNTIEIRAQRPAMAYWDGCCHLGINIDHATDGIT